jgi:hypothetical protein
VPGFEDADEATLQMSTEVLRTGLIGLALWWQEHPEIKRDQVVQAAMRALTIPAAPPAS